MTDYAFTVPGAERLASLVGLKTDLEQVAAYCDRMIERYAGQHLAESPFDILGFTTHVDFLDWAALSTAACICYARCFVSGVRHSLDADLLAGADSELRATHQFILDLRNKHVAHSVNSFEENLVAVHVEQELQSSTEIQTVTAHHNRTPGLDFDTPSRLRRLAQWWLHNVSDETSVEMASVLRIAQGMPLAQIREFARVQSTTAEDRRVNVGRRRRKP